MQVQLYVYDLSQGMAKAMSMAFIGRQIDGIWHTSVVAYGTEYFFGGGGGLGGVYNGDGISEERPGTTHFGSPLEIVDMGSTEIPFEVFVDFLNEIRPRYAANQYHLLEHNCNTFSNEVCQFLVGSTIPSHITSLPADFLQTPLGAALKPMIDQMFSSRTHHPMSSQSSISPAPPLSGVKSISSSHELKKDIETAQALIIITNSSRISAQLLKELSTILQRNSIISKGAWTAGKAGLFSCTAELDIVKSSTNFIGAESDIGFLFICNSELVSKIKWNSNITELKSCVEDLMKQAYPIHRHTNTYLQSPIHNLEPIKSQKSSNIQAIIDKIIKSANQLDETEKNWLHELKKMLENDSSASQIIGIKHLKSIKSKLDGKDQFALFDLLRLQILKQEIQTEFAKDYCQFLVDAIHQNCAAKNAENANVHLPLVLMIFKTAANALSIPKYANIILDEIPSIIHENIKSSPAQIIVNALLSHILNTAPDYSNKYSSDSRVMEVLSTVIFNISVFVSRIRQERRGLIQGKLLSDNDGWEEELNEPEYIVELVSALVHILSEFATNKHPVVSIENIRILLASTLHFVYLASSSLIDLITILEFSKTLLELENNSDLKQICKDLQLLLK